MGSRFERSADKKLLEKHQQILKELLGRNENKICADCKRRDPRWASANLGIFVCLRCSGVHRSLGVHISKVRSVDLDTWTPEYIENMQRWGNQRANQYWEARLEPGYQVDDARIESFIRSKYEYKKYAKTCTPEEHLISLGAGATSAVSSAQTTQQPPSASLLDFGTNTSTSNVGGWNSASAAAASVKTQAESNDNWADFSSISFAPPPVASQQPAVNLFQNSPSPSAASLVPAQKPPAGGDLKNSILSLYASPSASPQPAAARPPVPVQQQQQQLFGGFQMPPPQQQPIRPPASNTNGFATDWSAFQ